MTEPIGIGIIGAGGISHSHVLAYRSSINRDLARVVAIADIDEDAAKEQAEQYGIERIYTDWHEMLADPGVQAVSICTPPFLHVEQASRRCGRASTCCARSRYRRRSPDSTRSRRPSARAGRSFAGVFQHRVGQGAQQVKALHRGGALRPAACSGCRRRCGSAATDYYGVWWRGTWEQECGGVTMGHGIHSIDMLVWLMGEPASLIADAATVKLDIEVEDTSLATVRFRNGAVGQIIVTVNAQDNRSRLEIFGDELQAVSSESPYDPTREPFRLTSLGRGQRPRRRGSSLRRRSRRRRSTCTCRWCTTSSTRSSTGAPPLVSTAECRRSMELITGLYKSAMTGERVRFPIAADDPWYSAIPAAAAALR